MKFVVIDDDPSIAQMVKTMLESGGHTVKSYDSSLRALREISVEHPDCVITDNELYPRTDTRHDPNYLERLANFVRGADVLTTAPTGTTSTRRKWAGVIPA